MRILITGGAGFIGVNCATHFAGIGHEVIIFDNLSRAGSEKNLEWIKIEGLVDVITQKGPFDLILHMAAQVAVTTSVANPREDFEVNALGTFNLLEAIRHHNPETTFIYASTNKVYGEMEDLNIIEKDGRYMYQDLPEGVDEKRNLDFHSPYGCSKGSADQYCRDYYRIYGLKTIVMRQSCIYGYRQFGIEDQGWVAWFCIAAVLGKQITIYGDGKQIRDVLFIDDLVRAYELAYEKRDQIAGKVYNIGGGPKNTLSLHELIRYLEKLKGERIPLAYDDWRPGDQKVFIDNISLAENDFGWKPVTMTDEGIEKLYKWTYENRYIFE
ncbi:MAG: NAD-dependent epimerase/dehydratase family protein [Deltaproteobacteria bacterium]|nr:NAD-dependent epimerase/dehydratase family protein [Deltaproteobacteria bacterium]